VRLVDAPVSGGAPAAEAGRLLVMVGGADQAVEYRRPVFASFGDPVVHLGPVGAGQLTKLLNNLLFTASLGTAASTLALGRAFGIDPRSLADVMSHGSGNSFALARVGDAGGTLDRIAAFAEPLLLKDVALMADIATAAGAPPGAVLTAADDALALMNQRR
jgi:3-hydroxyisobutyrate dehydrogenase-like beta-hydroxyacid dehydrogenase